MTTYLFLPGLLSDGFVWQAVADALPAGTPIHIADLSQGTSIEGMAAHALAEVSGDVIALGHSMGGRVAMEVARQAPDRVKALVLANTGHGPTKEGEEPTRQQKIDLGHRSMQALAEEWLPPMLDEARIGDTDLMAMLTDMVLRAGPDAHERHIRALLGRPDAGAYLPGIACPILLLTGREDRWSPVAQHEEIASLAPDADLVVIEDSGHFMPVERPEETSRAILSWLAARGFL